MISTCHTAAIPAPENREQVHQTKVGFLPDCDKNKPCNIQGRSAVCGHWGHSTGDNLGVKRREDEATNRQ